jgi:mannose-6-phosphate isomerase-like protein (cupin superfamily)
MSGAQDEFSTARPKVLRREDLDGFRISPDDTNYMIPLADALRNADDGVNFTAIIEVFAVGGKTPPNTHHIAAELFYVLDGHARARANGESRRESSMSWKTPAALSCTP